MMLKPLATAIKSIAIPAAMALAAGSAFAAPIFQGDFSGNAALATDSAPFEVSFNNTTSATSGVLNLDLLGYGSLDGDNGYIDIFSLAVNGTSIFSGTFNMDGGGTNRILSGLGTYTTTANCSGSTYCGGTTNISLNVALLANTSNTLTFSYFSPTVFEGTSRAGTQGTGDEAWGVGKVSVNAVPEPETYAMLLAGLGMLGTIVRRRRRQAN